MKQPELKLAVQKYLIGFGLSLLLTLTAFWFVFQYLAQPAASNQAVVMTIVALAVVQLVVQLHYFLHLGHETKPRWNMTTFLFMILVLVILVFGSLWIMDNLNYNMSPTEMKEYLDEHPGSF